MAVPKRRKSRSNTHHRRSQWKTKAATVVECPQCKQPKLPHTACAVCGVYDNRRVLEV